MANVTVDTIKVEKLVRELLEKQALTVLPQNSFGDAVRLFVDKDEKRAVEVFVDDSLSTQLKHLMENENIDEDDIHTAMDETRARLEDLFASGRIKRKRATVTKPRPEHWDSDADGEWEAQPAATVHSDIEPAEEEPSNSTRAESATPVTRGKATRGRGGKARGTAKGSSFEPKRSRPKNVIEDDDEDDGDIIMLDDDVEAFIPPPKPVKAPRKPAAKPRAVSKKADD